MSESLTNFFKLQKSKFKEIKWRFPKNIFVFILSEFYKLGQIPMIHHLSVSEARIRGIYFLKVRLPNLKTFTLSLDESPRIRIFEVNLNFDSISSSETGFEKVGKSQINEN